MRVGQNPARSVEEVAQPAPITVAVVNCIPFLSGYYEQSLDVLKACVNSIHDSTPELHDLMVFDNHSCRDVRQYLEEAFNQGLIQYLVLSDKNIGKIGAWNFMFGAAQGKYVVFSDGDIGFRSGWLAASLNLFEAFPNLGMVTARPLPTPDKYSTATFDWARKQPAGVLEEGNFLPWDVYIEHVHSLGFNPEKKSDFAPSVLYRLIYGRQRAYIGAAHFQFTARAEVLRQLLPLPSDQPMRGERALDEAINNMGLLRLTTEEAFVWHMGNRISKPLQPTKFRRKTLLQHILWLPPIRRVLLWLNNHIFKLYFLNVE
jgi:glycosyltransferase involved in cell wall biosynthesis